MDYSKEDLDNIRILDENCKRRKYEENTLLQEGLKTYSDSLERSQIRSKVRKEGHRKKVISDIKRRTLALLLAGTALVTTYTVAKNHSSKDGNQLTGIHETIKRNTKIDNKIEEMVKMMSISGTKPIEISYANAPNGDPIVLYGGQATQNLVDILVESAQISEEEFRCAVLAAYKVINEQYRERELNIAFNEANQLQQNSVFIIPESIQEYFETLGYENIQDYNDNERSNIKKIEQIEIESKGTIKK